MNRSTPGSARKLRRVLLEICAPPGLGALLVAISGRAFENTTAAFSGVPAFLLAAYVYGILPSVVYAAAMEYWFVKGLHSRCGSVSTVGFSSLLGLASGFCIQFMVGGTGWTYLPTVGALVGLLLGVYVAWTFGRSDAGGGGTDTSSAAN